MVQPAQFLFENARIFTADPSQPSAEAVAVRDNRIAFVGSRAEAQEFKGPGTRVIDANGGTLMPGFIDCHYHMLYGALNLDGMQLAEVTSYEELLQAVVSYAAMRAADAWLAGTGLRYNVGPGHAPLTRQHLDALVADRPVYINAFDGHTSWANTLALKMAGIFHGSETGPNSMNVLDEHGESTGELREPGAFKPVSDMVPKPDEARKGLLLRKALRLTASLGVTSVHNMNGDEPEAALYAALEGSGELSCRIYIPLSFSPEVSLQEQSETILRMKRTYAGAMLRAGSVKFFVDGVIEGYTGLLVEPYADDPSTCGSVNYEIEDYHHFVAELDRLGIQIFTHSVGDMGVRRVLDAYGNAQQRNGKRDARHRIEHIELVHPDDLHRFQELGVLASMQPLHAPAQVDENDIWPMRVGPQRWPLSFAWQSLREAGSTLVFGSDWPVVTQNPLRAVAHAISRTPWAEGMRSHRQRLVDALISYTREAAYAEFQGHQKGQIRTGYLADLVMLPKDLFSIGPDEIRDLKPALTMVDGRVIYEA